MEHQTATTLAKDSSTGLTDMPHATKIQKSAEIAALSTPAIHDVKPSTPNIVPIPECRRSSRKKIIKFDVRDLLNKNRKPHKIQIEARIDSNVPNTSKASASAPRGETTFAATGLNAMSAQDLSSKQKAFMEKSAIFRRFSISQDQSKPPPPPPIPLPPTILSKVGDTNIGKNPVNVTGKRLNRSQEYYKNALLKSMPTPSLIVAQVESNVRSAENKGPRHQTADDTLPHTYSLNPEPAPQKKRGRPPKVRTNEQEKKSVTLVNKIQERTLSPEKAKNWKEYKACLAEQKTMKQESIPVIKEYKKIEIKQPSISSDLPTINKIESKQSDKTEQPLTRLLKSSEIKKQPDLDSVNKDQLTKIKVNDSANKDQPTPLNVNIRQSSICLEVIKQTNDFAAKPRGSSPQASTKACMPEAIEKIIPIRANEEFEKSKEEAINLCENEKREESKALEGISISKETNLHPDNTSNVCSNTSTSPSSTVSSTKYKSELFHKTATNIRNVADPSLLKINKIIRSPESESQNIKETNRTKRLHKQTKDTQRQQKTDKAIDVSSPSSIENINKEYLKSSDDNTSTEHKESILPASEKSNDTSSENSSSDSLLVTEIVEVKYKGENDGNSETKQDSHLRKSLRKRKSGTNNKGKGDIESNKELAEKKCEEKDSENVPKFESLSQSSSIKSCAKITLPNINSQSKSKEPNTASVEESSHNQETNELQENKLEEIDISTKEKSNELLSSTKDEVQTSKVRKSLRKQKDPEQSLSRSVSTENYSAEIENKAAKQTIFNRKSKEKSKSTPVHDLECAVSSTLSHNVRLASDCEDDRDLLKNCTQIMPLEYHKVNKDLSQGVENTELVLNPIEGVSSSVLSKDQCKETIEVISLNQIQTLNDPAKEQKDKCEQFSYEESSITIENKPLKIVDHAVDTNLALADQISLEENKPKCEGIISKTKSSENPVIDDTVGAQAEKVLTPNKDIINKQILQTSQFRDEENVDINTSPEQSKTFPNDDYESKIIIEKQDFKDDLKTMLDEECSTSALILQELEDRKQLKELPKGIAKEKCHQLAGHTLNADKRNLEKRSSLRKYKEPILIPNKDSQGEQNADDINNKLKISTNKSDEDSLLENIKKDDEFVNKHLCHLPSSSIVNAPPPISKPSQISEDVPHITKKRGRKNRFKNLHSSDIDSETTLLSKENTESTIPDLQSKCKENVSCLIEDLPKDTTFKDDNNSETEKSVAETSKEEKEIHKATNTKKPDLVTRQLTEEPHTIDLAPDPDSTKSYVIKNLSIETNTLLDILRTVQSNEAAVEAKKECETVPDILRTVQSNEADVEGKKECETVPEINDLEASLSSSSAEGVSNQQKLIESNSGSPARSTSVSPLNTCKIVSSPCRSDSSTPPVMKKSNTSPSRSNTSSPMGFNKKITRRYERRSRRGDDSTHKTLEETFAEIAALSSKAVLEMSYIDGNVAEKETIVEEETNVNKIKESEEFAENSTMPENVKVVDEPESEQKSNQSTSSFHGQLFPNDNTPPTCNLQATEEYQAFEECKKITTAVESSKVCPINTEKYNKNSKKVEENLAVEQKSNDESKDLIMDNINLQKNVNQYENESDKLQISTTLDLLTKQVEVENTLQQTPDPCNAENNAKIQTIDESFSPKSSPSKKDITQNKSECKSSNKKSSKKSKSFECAESERSSENISSSTTTTPPPKRGRKPKITAQSDISSRSPATSSGGKKKSKKEQKLEEKEELAKPKEIPDDALDEKIAKKKRQRKLREAFEAALSDQAVSFYDTPCSSPTFDSSLKSRLHSESELETRNSVIISNIVTQTAATEPEEDPDPLKDIEKFIEDGVNLLKKDYKIDDDSVDNVIIPNVNSEEIDKSPTGTKDHECLTTKELITTSFETPADTPIVTPSVTPPPRSPESSYQSEVHSSGGIRRSHRIKLITKNPKALVGRGLVRDKERFSIKDDVETKSHYTLDDHLLDLAEVEAKNAKFLKEMEERLSNFHVIKDNEYKCERVISKEARKMICDCFLTAEEEERGELGCGEDCLNRLLMIECGPECNVRERCTNKRFQKILCSPCRVFRTEKKGFGIMADIEILPGEFIMEYVGEVIDTEEFEKRRIAYSLDKNRHYYFMALRSDAIIDATIKGNISRFINHSCDPNAETQKWTVNGELRIGFFSRKSIMPGEEITFNYQYQRYGREAQRCYCESSNCRGWIGQEPNSDEGEQIDDDEDESDEDDEDEENSNLLEDDADSDSSVSDPEEVQKKLELAAAQAAAELAPISMDEAAKRDENSSKDKVEAARSETEEEDSKSKFKKLLSKMAEKVAAKHKQTKKEQKLQRKKKSKESSAEAANKQRFLEDPDIEGEVASLSRSGLKNQSHTLRLSRLMVRAKLVQTRLNLLDILRKGELPCRRLFLDYHGLRLVHGWMSEDAGNMQIRLALLLTLELLPIANKSMLTESKVMQVVRSWCDAKEALSPNEDSLSSNSNSQDCSLQQGNSSKASTIDESTIPERAHLQKLACRLVSTWDNLPEIFRIPKKERIEQMKEHEREADRQYAETEESRNSPIDIDRSSRFVKRVNTTSRFSKPNCSKQIPTTTNIMRGNITAENANNISKAQRREMFAAKVARDEAEKRMAEERREYETKCRFFGLDPKKTRPQDIPFYVNSDSGQWYSVERKPIPTPPSYAHFPVPENYYSTNPQDYHLPPVCATLPPQWKYAITPQGHIYYYHVQKRVPQWEPPTAAQLHECEIKIEENDSGNENTPTTAPDSSDEDDDILLSLDAAQLKAYIDRKVEARRQQRYQRLVDQRAISPRREEDRVYNQMEVRKYKENKEKIRKRKEDIRRKRAEASRQSTLNLCTLGGLTESNPNAAKLDENKDDAEGVLPIQDYLLSSDEDEDINIEINMPLIEKIVEGDKIVDELDALTSQRSLKRNLPSHREIIELPSNSSASVSSASTAPDRQEHKKRKLEKKERRKPKEQDAKYRKAKENFRCEIAGIIVHHLKPYRKDTCTRGHIKSNEDFNHLARKLTHFVMIKELKYCESVGQTLVVTESVKNKSREFIKKYMTKYEDFYIKPSNDPDFKDIPFTL